MSTWHKPSVTWKEWTSIELSWSDLPVSVFIEHFNNAKLCKRSHPTVGNDIPRQADLGYIRKVTDKGWELDLSVDTRIYS